MAERWTPRSDPPARRRTREPDAILRVRDLHVYYGQSHAVQGVNLTLEQGVLSVVGRNGMGKTTLCKAIMGLVHSARGSIRFNKDELRGLTPSQVANLGVGYVPQGRRLWPSLTVHEHLRLCERGGKRAAWSIERIYDSFPRLAERRNNGGGQLSGGEQQMLAIGRALLGNPHLLIMDEPTEGLAPVIVAQVEEMLLTLGEEEDIAVLVIEQNIGVATAISEKVAIMVNGRINRVMDAIQLAADRELQQRLLGVGRHGHEDVPLPEEDDEEFEETEERPRRASRRRRRVSAGPKVYKSNLQTPTRWSMPASLAEIMLASGISADAGADEVPEGLRASASAITQISGGEILVVGTLDTKGPELRFIRDQISRAGLRTRLVDLSTSGKPSGADVPPNQVAAYHRRGPGGVFSGDRGESIREMAVAFEAWIRQQPGIAGIISAGGSGGTALVTPGMRRLPIGIPKVMISTVASGNVGQYVGPSDIMMMYSVTDVQGLNRISREVLSNGASAVIGMVRSRRDSGRAGEPTDDLPAVGLTMFGVTTRAVQQIAAGLEDQFDCLVFHATGVGGRSMENLVDSGMLAGVIDVTTTEVCDMMFGGVFPATEDRFGAIIRTRLPYVGSCGALDMVNFGPLDTVPERYRGRKFYQHNPQVTLMRTTAEENDRMGRWIGERLNQMEGPVRFFLPEGGVSALDAPGQPFHDPEADRALFSALEQTVRQSSKRQLIRLPNNINDPEYCEAIVSVFLTLLGRRVDRRRTRKARNAAV
ncbi:ABC transporter permease [Microbaculum marinum]|uniref:UPF0261 protein V3328_08475 n=1 Tax=Microbaculum marinum TaxID=1764581 RepID=A0AAW9RRF5_9HYPH